MANCGAYSPTDFPGFSTNSTFIDYRSIELPATQAAGASLAFSIRYITTSPVFTMEFHAANGECGTPLERLTAASVFLPTGGIACVDGMIASVPFTHLIMVWTGAANHTDITVRPNGTCG